MLGTAAAVTLAAPVAPAQRPNDRRPPISLMNARARVLPRVAIAESSLPLRMRKALASAVGGQSAYGLGPAQAERERALAPSAWVSLRQLGRSGRREAMVKGPPADCGGDGNCPLLIFRWSGSRWALLLYAEPGEGFTIQPMWSNGLRDVVISQHGGPTEGELLYRFDGNRYVNAGCWNATWPANGNAPPRLRRCRGPYAPATAQRAEGIWPAPPGKTGMPRPPSPPEGKTPQASGSSRAIAPPSGWHPGRGRLVCPPHAAPGPVPARIAGMGSLGRALAACVAFGLTAAPVSAQKAPGRKPPVALDSSTTVSYVSQAPIARSPLPPKLWKALAKAVGDQIASGLGPAQARRQRALAPSASVTLEQLDGAGRRQAMVLGPLADRDRYFNCPMFILRWTGRRWALLLRATGDRFFLQPARADGLRDVAITFVRSATESTVFLYQFSGNKYARVGCWRAPRWPTATGAPTLWPCH